MSGSLRRSAKSHRRSRSTPLLPIFEDFTEVVGSCFAFLIQRYGFEGPDLRQYGRECSVVFRRLPWVAVRISYEPGGNPWVVLTVRLGAASDDPQELSLDGLIRERCEGRLPNPIRATEPFRSELSRVLHGYAEFLEKCCGDLLQRNAEELPEAGDERATSE